MNHKMGLLMLYDIISARKWLYRSSIVRICLASEFRIISGFEECRCHIKYGHPIYSPSINFRKIFCRPENVI